MPDGTCCAWLEEIGMGLFRAEGALLKEAGTISGLDFLSAEGTAFAVASSERFANGESKQRAAG